MAVPKRKTSSRRRGNRRSHDAIGVQNLRPCSHCSMLTRPHRVCPDCGYYKGEQIIVKVLRGTATSTTET